MTRVRLILSVCGFLFVATLGLGTPAAQAQESVLHGSAEGGETRSVQALVDAAREDGYQIILVPPTTQASEPATGAGDIISLTATIEARARAAREALVSVIAALPKFADNVGQMIAGNAEQHGVSVAWPLHAIGLGIVFLTLGYACAHLFNVWASEHFRALFNPEPQSRAEKIAYLLIRALMMSVAVGIQAIATGVLIVGIGPEEPPFRTTMMLMLVGTVAARITIVIFRALIAPDAPSHRLVRIHDQSAHALYRGFSAVTWLTAVVGVTCIQMDLLGVNRDAHHLMLMVSSLLAACLFATLAVRHRAALGTAILGGLEKEAGLARSLLARFWHIIAIAYFAGAWVVSAVRLLLHMEGAVGVILNPLFALVIGFLAYAVMLLIIDRVFERRGTMTLPEAGSAEPVRRRGFKELSEAAAAAVILAGCFLFVLDSWAPHLLSAIELFEGWGQIVIVLFGGYLAYESVKILIDDRIAMEEATDTPAQSEDSGEGGGAGASRLATLLPIFRNFLLAVIVAIAGMVSLSHLGVDIAPLFAGAGVVGLAVGFGAQTLIRDIFSGAFFLLDDAFRKGEYIEINGIRGTVEKISVRSMQLRHQLGLLHTVPFGEITSLTNYSRDWVMMKLPLRLTYDTDPEMVRKLVKKLGQELLEHPEIGQKFLEPLKSQGVYQMEESAMIIRVKFMTKPGDQFMVRKVVYERIRELFERNGIHFAHREVTVRIADGPNRPLTEAEKEGIAGAVSPVLDVSAAGTGDTR